MNEQVEQRQPAPQLSQMGSWVIASVVVGWLIAYNVLRLGGDTPREAAMPGLIVGGIAGLLVFAAGFVAVRRLHAAGRVIGRRPTVVGGTFDDDQRDALRVAAVVMLGVAGIALITAIAEAVEWFGISGDRPIGTLVLMLWNAVFALWVADEALRVRRSLVDGIETVYFGCLLTVVLASVAISRGVLEPMQVVLALSAGVAALAVGMAVWRLGGGRGVPVAMIGAVVVTVGALALPVLV